MAMTERVDGLPDLPTPDEINDGVLHVFDELDAPESDATGGFRITDDGSADWAARKLAGIRAKIAKTEALAERQVLAIMEMVESAYLDPIRMWREEALSPLLGEETHWEGMLELYHRDVVLVEDPKAKTVTLPHGTLKARKSPDRWEFEDEIFMAWARDIAPELIRTKQEVDKALVKKTLQSNGMGGVVLSLPEGQTGAAGVTVTPGEVTFTVETEVAQ